MHTVLEENSCPDDVQIFYFTYTFGKLAKFHKKDRFQLFSVEPKDKNQL